MHFQDEIAIVITRYDRIRTQGGLRRVHQEDVCQALAINPARKYQNEGGPGIAEKLSTLLRIYSGRPDEDVETFVDSIIYNWLIVGTDAHAKNYALLIGAGGSVRLAPLYDLASALPYPQIDLKRAKMSMKIGGECKFQNVHDVMQKWLRTFVWMPVALLSVSAFLLKHCQTRFQILRCG